MTPEPNPLPFNDAVVTDNQLLAMTLDAGTLYMSGVMGFEAPGHQQTVVDQLTRQAELLAHPSSPFGVPPLTPAQMREFVVSPRLYNDRAYKPPPSSTGPSPITPHPDLPTPIRQLKEVADHPLLADPESPLVAAEQDLQFFEDLWAALFSPAWDNHAVVGGTGSVNLRALWVSGGDAQNQPNHMDQVFWYRDPTNVTAPDLRWIDLPADFPLIDFLWTESELSRGFTAGTAAQAAPPAAFSQTELNEFSALVNELVTWELGIPAANLYHNLPSSPGACLLQLMRMGYGGTGPFARKWVRLWRGAVEHQGSGFQPLDPATGQPTGAGNLVQQGTPWSTLAALAFPWGQHETLFGEKLGHLQPPYAALYSDPATHQVRATLRPEDINALVEFFLRLGAHYIDPDDNGDNPSRKLARFELRNGDEEKFLKSLPGTYPLTSGLARVTVARALLDTKKELSMLFPGQIPPFGQVFRARVYDPMGQSGQVIWPRSGPDPDAECVGGALRAVNWLEDPLATGWVESRGYQPEFLGLGGSYATLLTLFPDNQGDPESYFWCTPGVEAMGIDAARFDLHMNAFTTNTLLRTHYSDFETNYVSLREHYYGY